MVNIAAKSVFITVFAIQCKMVISLHTDHIHEILTVQDLNRIAATLQSQQSMTKEYLITSPAAKQLRAKLGGILAQNKPSGRNDKFKSLRQRFEFLFKAVNWPEDKLDLLAQTQQKYNEKYAARIARYSKYIIQPKIFFSRPPNRI